MEITLDFDTDLYRMTFTPEEAEKNSHLREVVRLGRKYGGKVEILPEKPPLGCTPQWKYKEDRVRELAGAINRYSSHATMKDDLMLTWLSELMGLILEIREEVR
jgi:hypothetical protein